MKDFWGLSNIIKLRIAMLFLGILCNSTTSSSMTIYYNQYLGAGLTGLMLIISSLVVFLVGLYAGHLSDKIGRRPIMLYATLITMTGSLIAAFSNSAFFFNPWTTYLGLLLGSFGFGFFDTAATAMMIDITTVRNRSTVYSIQYVAANLAILIGASLSGWFFRDYLFWLLLSLAVEEAVSFVVIHLWIPESVDKAKAREKREKGLNIFQTYRMVSRDRAFLLLVISSVFTSMLFAQTDYYLPVHLSKSFHQFTFNGIQIYGQRMLTLFLIVNTLIIVLFLGFVRRVSYRLGTRRGASLGLALMGVGFIVAFLGDTFTVELVAVLIETVGEMIYVPFGQAYSANLMAGEQTGAYSGASAIAGPVASILSGLLLSGSALYGNIGMSLALVAVIAGAVFPLRRSVVLFEARGGVLGPVEVSGAGTDR